ncbi:MAG TPA: hypothetical protein VH247_08320 [Thermoleophilaceae bacterium]|jgi:hypothetical protein|nr:hypothetical protein [Thermoleophilaceae bacterium]
MSLLAVLTSTALVCVASVAVGQAVWRMGGFDGWAWLAPPVGLATLVAVAGPAVAAPGAGMTGAVVLLVLSVGALVFCVRTAARSEVLETALVGALALAVAYLPFAAAGRVGILAVTDNPDFYGHLMVADALRAGDSPVGLDPTWAANYPKGPHSLAASLASGLGIPVDAAFTGLLLAILVVSALTALSVLREASLPRRVVGALIGGVPYLAASYTVQASFKETLFGVIVVAWALALPPVAAALRSGPRAVVPLLALSVGAYAVYGVVGVAWLGAVAVVYAAAAMVVIGGVRSIDRRALLVGGGAAAVAVVALVAIAQVPEANALIQNVKDIASGNSTGGNIRAELPFYEVFGAWPRADLRMAGSATGPRLLAALAAGVATWAVVWWVRRRRFELPSAVAVTLAIYAITRATASPYYAGKALAISAFAVGVMTIAAVVLALPPLRRIGRLGLRGAGAAVAVVVLAVCAWSSALALRGARVAPSEHSDELASLRSLVKGAPTLYMGENDYIPWILRGSKVAFPYINLGRGQVELVQRPDKPWNRELGFDFDDVDPAGLDRFRYVIAPRTPYASQAPRNWQRVRMTNSYVVWKRSGATAPRSVLAESGAPGAVLDCSSPVAHSARAAAVEAAPVVVPPTALRLPDGSRPAIGQFARVEVEAGDEASARVQLPPGRWTVSLQYVSPVPLELNVGSSSAISAPASLEGPGAYWRVGEITSGGGTTTVEIRPKPAPLLAAFKTVALGSLAFTRARSHDHLVPLRRACGHYVDWYR